MNIPIQSEKKKGARQKIKKDRVKNIIAVFALRHNST